MSEERAHNTRSHDLSAPKGRFARYKADDAQRKEKQNIFPLMQSLVQLLSVEPDPLLCSLCLQVFPDHDLVCIC
jgi:hypothetical protein